MPSPDFAYRLDRDNLVASVCDDWDELTAGFSTSGTAAAALVGTSIFGYITGAENRHLFEMLFERCRASARPLSVHFRCDSPELRRYMLLELTALGNGEVQVVSRLARSVPRPYVALLDHAVPRSGRSLLICAWCKQVNVAGRWLEVEEAVEALGLFGLETLPMLTHGACPVCQRRLLDDIGAAGPRG